MDIILFNNKISSNINESFFIVDNDVEYTSFDIINDELNDIKRTSSNNNILFKKINSFNDDFTININNNNINNNNMIETDKSTETFDLEDNTKLIKMRKNKLVSVITESKKKINNSLYIISTKYDLVYHKYNKISLYILIIQSIENKNNLIL